jgi:hypothetical protein
MQVISAQSRARRELIERGWLLGAFDKPAKIGHLRGVLRRERGLMRLASFARAETGALGVGHSEVERHVLWPCATCSAGRPAVHAGGPDGVEEFSILLCVACRDCRPARIAHDRRRENFISGDHVHLDPFDAWLVDSAL